MELASIGAFLDRADGGVTALLIEGEAGIGKSWLMRKTVRAAGERGYRVLACQPTESEAGIGSAGLIDLPGLGRTTARLSCRSRSDGRSMLP